MLALLLSVVWVSASLEGANPEDNHTNYSCEGCNNKITYLQNMGVPICTLDSTINIYLYIGMCPEELLSQTKQTAPAWWCDKKINKMWLESLEILELLE